MAQREQVLDRAQRLQQAFVNNALRNQAGHRLGPYSRSAGLFMRRSYRNYQNVIVLMHRHLPVDSAGKSTWPKCSLSSGRAAGIDGFMLAFPRCSLCNAFFMLGQHALPHARNGFYAPR